MSQASSSKQPDSKLVRKTKVHSDAKESRNRRFGEKIYGVVHAPVIPKGVIGAWDPPTYLQSRRTSMHSATVLNDGIDRKLDLRCFYTGVVCDPPPAKPESGWNMDPKLIPWMGTRDHLVPARRDVPGCPIDLSKHRSTLVWSSHMANVVFGLTPLLVKLKIRQWMVTIPYDRDDRSIWAGHNIKWLIINLLDDFRINGRYPWSRKHDGSWWYPRISEPFMARMWRAEERFLALDEDGRNRFIREFSWQF
jgi:hypothetical protein